jgi:hypothetical protein
MQQLEEQIDRIKKKLVAAKKADRKRKVFGADSHQYFINKPLEPNVISSFEATYQVTLPESFKAFLLHIGNGGKSYADSAAGPFYGIYPLGTRTGELTDDPEKYLREPVKIYPDITLEAWNTLTAPFEDDDMPNETFDAAMGNIFAGILPLGSQGCAYLHGLVLNGPHTGKVVNLDSDRQLPKFAFEDTFLDWYERWLDEVISENLIVDTPSWFGYTMGGSASSLLEKYQATNDRNTRFHCLSGILTKQNIPAHLIPVFENEYKTAGEAYKRSWLQILTKCDYAIAKPHLLAYFNMDPLAVFQFIFWYAKDKSIDWRETIAHHITRITDGETFRFCTYLLVEMKIDYGPFISPMTQHENADIRQTAFYTLGKLVHKAAYLDFFLAGLNDSDNNVLRDVLQALDGITDKKLLPAYKKIAARFPEEQDYILSNLEHRLKEFRLTVASLNKLL